MAGVDILASAFSGANAAFLGEQYARWAANPHSVDPTFAELFGALNDDARAVLEEATGASWAPRHPEFEEEVRPAVAQAPRPTPDCAAVQRAGPRRHHRLAARADADPLLSRARPSGGAARSARTADPAPARRTRSAVLWFHRQRPRQADLHRQRARPRDRDAARNRQTILRETYCGPIGVEFMHIQDPDQKSWIQRKVEGAPWRTAFDAQRQAHHPDAAHRGGRLRGVLPEALRHHQALRPGGRRIHASRRCTPSSRPWPRPACRRSPSACRIAAG